MFRSIAITLTLGLTVATAQAALVGREALSPGGTDYQAYYDDVLNITWLADANLAGSTTFGILDILPDGRMNWYTANQWVNAMNAAAYLGVADWRLPLIVDTGPPGCVYAYFGTDCGLNVDLATSELAHLYQSTLGNESVYNSSGVLNSCASQSPNGCLGNRGPFSNVLRDDYWSGTEYAIDPVPYNNVWFFSFQDGSQSFQGKADAPHRSWAVRSGDIAVVPLPAAIWLFASALGFMGAMRRKISS